MLRRIAVILTLGISQPALASDLGPLLDGMLEGCAFSEELSLILEALPEAAPRGETIAVPASYAASTGQPYLHEKEDYSYWRLPLTGQWKGLQVAGIERIGIDETGVYVIVVNFADGRTAVEATLGTLAAASQALLEQDESFEDFGFQTGISDSEGFATLYCNLST